MNKKKIFMIVLVILVIFVSAVYVVKKVEEKLFYDNAINVLTSLLEADGVIVDFEIDRSYIDYLIGSSERFALMVGA